jgi:hypothetical protein
VQLAHLDRAGSDERHRPRSHPCSLTGVDLEVARVTQGISLRNRCMYVTPGDVITAWEVA